MYPVATVKLRKGKAKPFWYGNPIVYSGAIAEVCGKGNIQTGDLVEVRDHDNILVGWGFFNPVSSYRVRIIALATQHETAPDIPTLLSNRINEALALRAALGLPSSETTAFRMMNSEGDGLSGLIADVFLATQGTRRCVVIVSVSAAWAVRHLDLVERCLAKASSDLARSFFGTNADLAIAFRPVPSVSQAEGLPKTLPRPASVGPIVVSENGLRFLVDTALSQKTGFYIDQRENRLLARTLARALKPGARALDCFCFTGGFAINLAFGGASHVLAVDTQEAAIEVASENVSINGLESKVRLEKADALEVLKASPRTFDLIVCDPPGYAKSAKTLQPALAKYRELNKTAILALRDGGVLVTCTCSAAVRRDLFLQVLRDAAKESGRRFAVTHVRGAAPDHPIHPAFPEGEYLTCVVGVAA